jgi:Family of unknown function (DUF6069)
MSEASGASAQGRLVGVVEWSEVKDPGGEEGSMSSEAAAQGPRERVVARRLWWVGPLAVISSVAANVLFAVAAVAIFRVPPEFQPLTVGAIATFTALGVIGAVVVFALVARFSGRPISLFRRIALIVLLVSLLPDLALPLSGEPGVTPLTVALLMLTHVIAAAVSVAVLTTLTRETPG